MARKTVASNAREIASNDERLDRIEEALTALFVAQDLAFRAQNGGDGLIDVYGRREVTESDLDVMDSLTALRFALVGMKRVLDGPAADGDDA